MNTSTMILASTANTCSPEYAGRPEFLAEPLRPRVRALIDADGLVKESHEHWRRW